jgi:hypothetical protein
LRTVLDFLRKGDVLMVTRIDRLARSIGDLETNLRRERQLEGIAKAKAAGVYKGRPASIDAAQVRQMKSQGMGPPLRSPKLSVFTARASKLKKSEASQLHDPTKACQTPFPLSATTILACELVEKGWTVIKSSRPAERRARSRRTEAAVHPKQAAAKSSRETCRRSGFARCHLDAYQLRALLRGLGLPA